MPAPESVLDRIEIASPCSASWEAMEGDERSRFCGDCKLMVHNLSAMSRAEGEGLLAGAKGRVCTRFFRRSDGTVITQDCGPIRRGIQRRLRLVRVAATALFGILAALTTSACGSSNAPSKEAETPTQQKPEPKPVALMGDVCISEERLGRIALPVQQPASTQPAPALPKD
jgi:hypothetical protein